MKRKKKQNNNMGLNDIKIFLNMKNKKVEKRMTMIAIIIIIFFNIDICFIAFEYMLMLLKIAYAS